jgi:hypothetical protein
MKGTIVILVHENDLAFRKSIFTLNLLAQIWEDRGIKVKIAYGVEKRIEGDIIINHVDLTVTPPEYLDYMNEFPVQINRHLHDISKRVYCKYLLQRDEAYDGPVLVKTNENYGGVKDEFLRVRQEKPLVSGKKDWSSIRVLDSNSYPIFRSIRHVPSEVWTNENLIVQKFLAERDRDANFILRCWSFMGNRGFQVYVSSTNPIVKGTSIIGRNIINGEVPDELCEVRNKLRMDCGRFDYVMAGGKVVLYDVNRTPTTSRKAQKCYSDQIVGMAEGVRNFL